MPHALYGDTCEYDYCLELSFYYLTTILHVSRWATHHRVDTRTWKERRKRELDAWDPLIDCMADAYTLWKYGSQTRVSSEPEDTRYPYHIVVMDIFTLAEDVTIHRPPTSNSPAVDLASHGYLCKTPAKPKIAVGFRTLELFHRVRLRKASLSIEAFTRVICDYYDVRSRVHSE